MSWLAIQKVTPVFLYVNALFNGGAIGQSDLISPDPCSTFNSAVCKPMDGVFWGLDYIGKKKTWVKKISWVFVQ